MAPGRPIGGGAFRILEDRNAVHSAQESTSSPIASRDVLEELPIDHYQNQRQAVTPSVRQEPPPKREALAVGSSAEPPFIKPTPRSQVPRRRPPIETETFHPLEPVEEEVSAIVTPGPGASSGASLPVPAAAESCREYHPLSTVGSDCARQEEISKHFAGQFEWLVTYPSPVGSAERHGAPDANSDGQPGGNMVFGCNLISCKRLSDATAQAVCPADTYTLIATPIGDVSALPLLDESSALEHYTSMAMSQTIVGLATPLKVPERVEVVEHAVSPSLSFRSKHSGEWSQNGTPRGKHLSVPRIEDSLEELDKLEEELEAVNAFTQGRQAPAADCKPTSTDSPTSQCASGKAPTPKRVSIAGQFATVRAKPSEKTRAPLRRSASFILRDKTTDEQNSVPEPKVKGTLSRSKSTTLRPAIKSTKPPTVPNFELPGEAVARRLKEQREARQAQQVEPQNPPAAAQRPRSSKPLTRPTFELPGEAISRRKREEREARLKAQEEEERKRRDFKARPFRQSVAPSSYPRETITSRARQNKAPQDGTSDVGNGVRANGLSMSSSNHSPARGRHVAVLPPDNGSRATSTSTSSLSGKRSTLSSEDASHQRLRGREIFHRDNSFTQQREQEKRDRESKAKMAREQAAERSRAASREWAEKKRQRELAIREAMRASAAFDASL